MFLFDSFLIISILLLTIPDVTESVLDDLNEIVTTGEIIDFNVPIIYNGSEAFSNVTGVLTSDGYANIISNTVDYGTISNGINQSNENFTVQVTDLQEHNSLINFYITLTDNSGNEFVTNISLVVVSLSTESFIS